MFRVDFLYVKGCFSKSILILGFFFSFVSPKWQSLCCICSLLSVHGEFDWRGGGLMYKVGYILFITTSTLRKYFAFGTSPQKKTIVTTVFHAKFYRGREFESQILVPWKNSRKVATFRHILSNLGRISRGAATPRDPNPTGPPGNFLLFSL